MSEYIVGVLIGLTALVIPIVGCLITQSGWFSRRTACRTGVHRWRGAPANTDSRKDIIVCQLCGTTANRDDELDRDLAAARLPLRTARGNNWERIIRELGHRVIDRDADDMIGELVEVDIPHVGREKFLRVLCGTGRRYALAVPPEMRTAIEANAWTLNVEPDFLKTLEKRT